MTAFTDTLETWLGAAWQAPLMAAGRVAVILLLALLAQRGARRLLRLLRERITAGTEDAAHVRRVETVFRVLRYLLTAIVVLIAGLLVLSELGVSIAPILGAAGIVGIALGFGAQSLVKDYFAGFFLLLENQIAKGDVVEIAGCKGTVEDVTLRYVRLRDFAGNVHYVPNGLVTTVTNMSRDFAYAVVDVGVDYREDLDAVFEAMRECAAAMQQDPVYGARILEPLEIAGVDQLGDSAVIVRCRIKTHVLEQWPVRREYLKRVKAAFDARGIEIPYPHLTLHVGAGKDGRAPAVPFREA